MTRDETLDCARSARERLKDFQSATVDSLYQGLFGSDQRRMLVADEVGLGKTIVAHGLIARYLEDYIQAGKRKPFTVTYICSNQVIAHENLKKLNIFPEGVGVFNPISRIIEVAREQDEDSARTPSEGPLRLNTLTPATSFHLSNSTGQRSERAIIFALLQSDVKLRNRSTGLRWILKSSVRKIDRLWSDFKRECEQAHRKGLAEEFIKQLKRKKLPFSDHPRDEFYSVYEHLGGNRERNLYEALVEYSDKVRSRQAEKQMHWACYSLTVEMRKVLIQCCLKYVDADLYILDEFQRFRDLIDPQNEDEAAQIAQRLFSKKDTRILLLSATPFKAFTAAADIERGDDHHRDFSKVLEFLLEGDVAALEAYEQHRKALYHQFLDLKKGELNLDPAHKQAIEQTLRRVMCRTERHQVSTDPNALLDDTWKKEQVPFSQGDIHNFRLTDQLAQALNRIGKQTHTPIEYAKSALCPLSFMDRYRMKEVLKERKNKQEIAQALRQSKDGWVNFSGISQYQWQPGIDGSGPANARLNTLIEKSIGDKGSRLLWIPPSMPYYSMEGPYAGAEGFTKTLLFSSWIMVPRMVASLVSYEVERQTIGNPATVEPQEKGRRTYFTEEGKNRNPAPLLTYARRNQNGERIHLNMSNFTLLYPSRYLMEVVKPVMALRDGKSLPDMKAEVADQIRRDLDQFDLDQFTEPGGESERWYWAAPLLLDRAHEPYRDIARAWFEKEEGWGGRPGWFNESEDNTSAKEEHFNYFERCFLDPRKAKLGTMPRDLPEVLADLAFGSPAVLTLRGFVRLFPQETKGARMVGAFDTADDLTNLFNKPEAIAAIRLSYPDYPHRYWRMVSQYCGDGCLQAVLEEYFHILKGQTVDTQGAIQQLLNAINLTSASINVDNYDTFIRGKPGKMRCHYAVEFGSQKIETDEGKVRAISLREVFNSPFRPFVLATTSIGQEGLDFHSYCRRIVHWNLPSNPVDLEQREGRINRYKGLVIRQHIAKKYGQELLRNGAKLDQDVWEQLFELADQRERKDQDRCELVPYWHVDATGVKIERVVPMYPFSRDQAHLESILRTLALYRLAFGQPRQAELVDHLLDRNFTPQELEDIKKSLMIDLSPISFNTSF